MNRIKELREQKHLTLRQLGVEVNMTSSRLSQYETEKREPKLEVWQELANYFNVSVPYLQGIEPDYTEVTIKTKKVIAMVMNKYYFNNLSEYEFELPSLKKSIDKYVSLSNLDILPTSLYSKGEKDFNFTQKQYKYWKINFSFLFAFNNENKELILDANKYIDGLIHATSWIASDITSRIDKEILQRFQSPIGSYFDNTYKSEFTDDYLKFIENMRFIKNRTDIEKHVNSYQKSLTILKNNMISDIEKGIPQKKKEQKESMLNEAKKYINKVVGLINTDVGFRNYIVRKGGNELVDYRDYLNELEKDTTGIDNFLKKYPEYSSENTHIEGINQRIRYSKLI